MKRLYYIGMAAVAAMLAIIAFAAPVSAADVTYSSFGNLGNEIAGYSNAGTGDPNVFEKAEAGTRTDTVITGYRSGGDRATLVQSGEVVGCPSHWGGWKRNVNPHTCLKPFNRSHTSKRRAITGTVEVGTVTTTTKVLEFQPGAPPDEAVKITTTTTTVDAS